MNQDLTNIINKIQDYIALKISATADPTKILAEDLQEILTELVNYLDTLPAFEPIAENQYGTHPAFADQNELNAHLLGGTYVPPAIPAAPTSGIVDNTNNTFDFTLSQY